MLSSRDSKDVDQEVEKRYQALATKKDRFEFLKKNGWERLRTEELKKADKTFWVVYWRSPDGKQEMTQSAAIRKQIRYGVIMEKLTTQGAQCHA